MSVTQNPTPAGAWIRVSTLAQDEANQVPDVEKYCAARGYFIAKRYELNDKSAYHGEQEAKQAEALADTKGGVIKSLVIWASDRLERRGSEATLRIFRQFGEAGGRVESVLEPFLNGEDPELMIAITGWKDRQESKRKSERVRIKHDALKAAGSFIGRPPLLYEVVKLPDGRKTIAPTPEGTKYIPEICQRITDGDSLATVCRWLEAETGRPWWPRSLAGLVRNPVLIGFRCEYDDPHRKTYGTVLHRCAPVVDADTWQKANDRLSDAPRRGPRLAHRAMLTGVIFCPHCPDSPMYRIWTGGGKRGKARIAYYRCAGRGSGRKGCGNMVRCDVADAAMEKIAATTFRYRKVTVTRFIPGSNHEAELKAVKFEIRQLDPDEDGYPRRARPAAGRAEAAEGPARYPGRVAGN